MISKLLLSKSMEYYFDNRKDIEANSGGEIPRWRYPCVAKVVTCDLKANEPVSTGTLVLIVSAIVGMIVVLICLCGSCHYCILKASTASVGSGSETSSTISNIENWNNNSKYQDTFRRRTPTLE